MNSLRLTVLADLWRYGTTDANRVLIHGADLYRELLTSVAALASDATVADSELRDGLDRWWRSICNANRRPVRSWFYPLIYRLERSG